MGRITRGLLFIMTAALLSGCATPGSGLLQKDYQAMSDDDLLKYYYELDEAIDKCEREGDGTAVGVGTGVGGPHFGVGVGVSRDVSRCDSTALRDRRVDVRMELKKRGLNP